MPHILPVALLLSLSLMLGACASQPEKLQAVALSDGAHSDPWENTNRKIYAFNDKLDRYVASPVTNVYRTAVPREPRRGIGNFYAFAREPAYFANAVLQAKPKSAFRALTRVVINGVLGLGLADHATGMGLPVEPHDFGQTLAVWGVPSGNYFFVPLLGPNTVRDAFGFTVDFILDPADIARNHSLSRRERYYMLGGRVLDFRSGLMDQGEQLLVGAADPYATMRSGWLQLRRNQLFDGNPPVDDLEDLDDWDDPDDIMIDNPPETGN